MEQAGEITRLLVRGREGDEGALTALASFIYPQLHKLAEQQMYRESNAHAIQPAEVVNEAFIRLLDGRVPELSNRGHFYAIAARIMRQILVDHARRLSAGKRGSGIRPANIDLIRNAAYPAPEAEVLALHESLEGREVPESQ